MKLSPDYSYLPPSSLPQVLCADRGSQTLWSMQKVSDLPTPPDQCPPSPPVLHGHLQEEARGMLSEERNPEEQKKENSFTIQKNSTGNMTMERWMKMFSSCRNASMAHLKQPEMCSFLETVPCYPSHSGSPIFIYLFIFSPPNPEVHPHRGLLPLSNRLLMHPVFPCSLKYIHYICKNDKFLFFALVLGRSHCFDVKAKWRTVGAFCTF